MQLRTIASKIAGLSLALVMATGVLLINAPKVSADNTIDDFVNRCYKVSLGREPDSDGFNFWKKEITEGRLDGSAVVFNFIFSKEYKEKNTSDKQFVNDLYTMFMGREADSSGYDFWCARLNEGSSREDIFTGFANSEEFYNVCSDCGITAGYFTNEYPLDQVNNVNLFVERMYKVCLGRIGDKGGQEFWVKGLLNRELQGIACAANFIKSSEYKSKNLTDLEYVKNMYLAMMGREFDKGGLVFWIAQLENGLSRDGVLSGFAFSKEFTDICSRYGIIPGTFTPDTTLDGSEYDSNNKRIQEIFTTGYYGVPKYDSNGLIIEENFYDPSGNPSAIYKYTRNSAGRMTKATYSSPDNKSTSTTEYKYDSDNMLIETSYVSYKNGIITSKYTDKYDSNELLDSRYSESYENGKLSEKRTEDYDAGMLVASKTYTADGILENEITYYPYDDRGSGSGEMEVILIQNKEYKNYYPNGNLSNISTYFEDGSFDKITHFAENGKMTSEEQYYPKENKKIVTNYDENGNRICKTICGLDKEGQVITEEIYDSSDNISGYTEHEYISATQTKIKYYDSNKVFDYSCIITYEDVAHSGTYIGICYEYADKDGKFTKKVESIYENGNYIKTKTTYADGSIVYT